MYGREFPELHLEPYYDNRPHNRFARGATWRWRRLLRIPPTWITPALADVSETMLWALHNRATEARRRDGVLADPESPRIHEMIDYAFTRHFGEPAGYLAARSAVIDRTLRL